MNRAGMVIYHGIRGGADLREYGRIADDLGYDSLWVTERYLHEETASMLGYLAAATSRVKLGVGVVNPFTRHPALLAMMAATLGPHQRRSVRPGHGPQRQFHHPGAARACPIPGREPGWKRP